MSKLFPFKTLRGLPTAHQIKSRSLVLTYPSGTISSLFSPWTQASSRAELCIAPGLFYASVTLLLPVYSFCPQRLALTNPLPSTLPPCFLNSSPKMKLLDSLLLQIWSFFLWYGLTDHFLLSLLWLWNKGCSPNIFIYIKCDSPYNSHSNDRWYIYTNLLTYLDFAFLCSWIIVDLFNLTMIPERNSVFY